MRPTRFRDPTAPYSPAEVREAAALARRMDAGVTDVTPIVCVLLPSLDDTDPDARVATSRLQTRLDWRATGAILVAELCAIAKELDEPDRAIFYAGMARAAADHAELLTAVQAEWLARSPAFGREPERG